MNHVVVIGPSYQQDVVYLNKELSYVEDNDGSFSYTVGGGCYLIALVLANLKCEVNLITRLGNDDVSTRLWNNLENKSVNIISHDIPFATPKKLTLVDQFNSYDIDNIPFEVHPGVEDNYPAFVINTADYGLLNVINSEVAYMAVNRFPAVRWVAYDYIPADDVLPNITGVVMTTKTASKMTLSDRFELAAQALLEKGVQWVIISDHGKGAWLYSNVRSVYHESDYKTFANYHVGCDELFVADLLCLLSRDFPLEICIQMALRFAAHKLDTANLSFPED